MRKIKIIADSTADLSNEILERYDIETLPLNVILGEKCYRDGLEIASPDIIKYVEQTKQLPKTSTISAFDLECSFRKYLDEDYDIIYTGIGGKLSSSNMTAQIVANSICPERIRVLDSQNLSTGTGLLVCKAGDMIKAGCGLDEVAKEFEATVPKVRASFIVDTLDYLYMGGRCSTLESFAAGILKLRPRLVVKDGSIISDKKYRGSFEHCLDNYIADSLADMTDIDKTRVFITNTYSEHLDSDAEKCAEALKPIAPNEVLHTEAHCVVFSHCGPRTIGILYINK